MQLIVTLEITGTRVTGLAVPTVSEVHSDRSIQCGKNNIIVSSYDVSGMGSL